MTGHTSNDDEDAALWQWTLDALLGHGCRKDDAVEGANLVLAAYKAERANGNADASGDGLKEALLGLTGT